MFSDVHAHNSVKSVITIVVKQTSTQKAHSGVHDSRKNEFRSPTLLIEESSRVPYTEMTSESMIGHSPGGRDSHEITITTSAPVRWNLPGTGY